MPSVLIVEDDEVLQRTYEFEFTRSGFDVTVVPDAETGLRRIMVKKPDAVLLDMMLPGKSGLEFLRELDLIHNYPGMKVFVLSNVESVKIQQEVIAQGAVNYLVKVNVTPEQVKDAVITALAKGTSLKGE